MPCSHESARAFILNPARSRWLVLWLAASHVTAVAGVLTLPIATVERVAALLAIAAHAYWQRPRTVGRVVAAAGGRWSLPDRGCSGLKVSAGSRVGAVCVVLRLQGVDRGHRVLLLRDQLSAAAWRQLAARVRLDLATTRLS